MADKAYYVRAQKKVGRQNIGPYLGVAFAVGDRAELIAKMQARFPNARVTANAYNPANLADIKNYFAGRNIAEVIL